MPEIRDKFNDAKIRLFDVRKLDLPPYMTEESFINDLKSSSWCGPYIWNGYPEWLEFYTVTEKGLFQGIRLILRLDEPDIRLHYITDTYKDNRGEIFDPANLVAPKIFKL